MAGFWRTAWLKRLGPTLTLSRIWGSVTRLMMTRTSMSQMSSLSRRCHPNRSRSLWPANCDHLNLRSHDTLKSQTDVRRSQVMCPQVRPWITSSSRMHWSKFSVSSGRNLIHFHPEEPKKSSINATGCEVRKKSLPAASSEICRSDGQPVLTAFRCDPCLLFTCRVSMIQECLSLQTVDAYRTLRK